MHPKAESKKLVTSDELSQKSMSIGKWVIKDKGKGKEVKPVSNTIPWPPSFFPQKLKKKEEEGKYQEFILMLKELSVNIPLVKTLEQMHSYAKFMNDLVTKKRILSFKLADNMHYCAISSQSLVDNKEEPAAFNIPCTIGSLNFFMSIVWLGS